jgi:exosortase/archaeosortase
MAGLKYWFKARGKRSVGWVPSAWQGWAVLALYVGLLIHSFLQIDSQTRAISDTFIGFFPRFLLFSAILIVVTYLMGEPTTWHHKE